MGEVFQQMQQISRSLNSFSSVEDETFEMRLPITYSAEKEEGKEDHESIFTMRFEDDIVKLFFEDNYLGYLDWNLVAAPAFKRALHVVPIEEDDE
jgi:hypothetical protein